MDFFQHQDKAKSRTFLLIVLYCLGLLGLVVVVAVAVVVFFVATETELDPAIVLLCIGSVLILVIGGSLCKSTQLSAGGGGRAVAESLGGRRVSPATTDPAERRLHNVVEEMALAAGVPMPTLYIMDTERSINAFAAGFSPNAAVIGVNRGTVELLTRDELQGVIAHEFSHILNGDMRMNLRLIGILFGLQLLAIVGYYAMRFSFYAGSGHRSSNDKGAGALVALLLFGGLALMIIGYIGVFFSAIIKAAISRQREFLADASAVQFTRNPDGIAGALKKIGCPNVGSGIESSHAAEASHLFFGDVCGLFSLGGLLATHPDLTTRIKRIDPHFDGQFPKRIEPVRLAEDRRTSQVQQSKCTKKAIMDRIGEFNIANVLAAGVLLDGIPKNVANSANNPLTAQAVFFAMLLDSNEIIRRKQISQIQGACSVYLLNETQRLYSQMGTLPDGQKIPLAQRVSAALREMTVEQYKRFTTVLDLLISADQKMDMFEYTIKAVLLRDLDIHFGLAKQLCVRYTTLSSVRLPVVAVLSYLAYMGHASNEEVQKAFGASMQELNMSDDMLPTNEATVQRFDQSLRMLAETCPALKKQIFAAFMTCVEHDEQLTPQEAGLIRAIAAMLAIPIPVLT